MVLHGKQMRVLEYIAAVNRGGWRPTGREINEWRRQPGRIPARRGKLIEAAVPATPARRGRKIRAGLLDGVSVKPLSSGLQHQLRLLSAVQLAGLNRSVFEAVGVSTAFNLMSQLHGEYEMIPGSPGRPAVYGPDRPKEKFLAHLRRLGWVTRDSQHRYSVTPLGDALLRNEALSESEAGDSQVTVLAADNEFAYGHVLGRISECGDALIADAYLGTEQLALILRHTGARRFLVGDRLGKARLTELAVLIETSPVLDGRPRELRKTAFHDRWLMGDGTVFGLGASLNGIGKQMTTLVLMPEVTAGVIEAHVETLWEGAEQVARSQGHDSEEGDAQVGDAGLRSVRDDDVSEVDGTFMHDRCTIKHRTADAAKRCTKGRSA